MAPLKCSSVAVECGSGEKSGGSSSRLLQAVASMQAATITLLGPSICPTSDPCLTPDLQVKCPWSPCLQVYLYPQLPQTEPRHPRHAPLLRVHSISGQDVPGLSFCSHISCTSFPRAAPPSCPPCRPCLPSPAPPLPPVPHAAHPMCRPALLSHVPTLAAPIICVCTCWSLPKDRMLRPSSVTTGGAFLTP